MMMILGHIFLEEKVALVREYDLRLQGYKAR
jgi:hypothetical protein